MGVPHLDSEWTTADVNDLPDSAFLYISPGGSKDEEGKTTPRSLRHFPVRDKSGALDHAHVANAIAQAPKADLPASVIAEVQKKGEALLAELNKKQGADHADESRWARGVARFDLSELKPMQMTPEGWAVCDGFIGRTGVLEYVRDGKRWVEYRPPEEAFNQDSLDSFDLVPLTNGHPPPNPRLHGARILDAENAQRFSVGVVASPRQDGQMVRSKIRITDAAAIEDVRRGRVQLSCGYLADVDPTPGVSPDGHRYDAIQRNVRGNHVALVDQGRAGPSARVRVDSFESEPVASTHGQGDHAMKTKIRLDGIDFEVECSDAAFPQALAKDMQARADAAAKLDKERKDAADLLAKVKADAKSDVDKATARADAAEAAVKAKTDELAKAPEKIKAELAARSKLVAIGVEILGQDAKVDEMDDQAIRVAVIQRFSPEFDADGKSAEYVGARFDAAVELSGKSALEIGTGPAVTRADDPKDGDDDEDEDEEKRNAFQAKSRAAAKKGKKPADEDDEEEDD